MNTDNFLLKGIDDDDDINKKLINRIEKEEALFPDYVRPGTITESEILNTIRNTMTYGGTIGLGGELHRLPIHGYYTGATYKVLSTGKYAGIDCVEGDLISCVHDFGGSPKNTDWVILRPKLAKDIRKRPFGQFDNIREIIPGKPDIYSVSDSSAVDEFTRKMNQLYPDMNFTTTVIGPAKVVGTYKSNDIKNKKNDNDIAEALRKLASEKTTDPYMQELTVEQMRDNLGRLGGTL